MKKRYESVGEALDWLARNKRTHYERKEQTLAISPPYSLRVWGALDYLKKHLHIRCNGNDIIVTGIGGVIFDPVRIQHKRRN